MTVELAPPRRRSYSQLAEYTKCPRLYRAKYVDRLPEQPAVWTVGGTAFHTCAEWYLRGELTEPTAERIHQAWTKAWQLAYDEACERNPLAAATPIAEWRAANRGTEDVTWWSWSGPQMVQQFTEWWWTAGLGLQVLDLDGPALEKRFEVNLGGVHVLAIPDALIVDEHGQIDILDYKSGKPPKESLQLGCYAAALRVATELEATYGLYYMTRAATALPIDLSRWPHHKIADMFADFDRRERSGDYSPTPGDHCRFCPVKHDCPAFERKSCMSVKYHLSVNGPNRELFGVQTENEPYHVFVGAAQEAGLDETLEKLSSGASTLPAAVNTVQAVFPNATQTITAPPPEPWGNPPVPAFQPAAQPPYQQAYQQQQPPQMPAAAAPQRGGGDVKNGHCAHGAATYREAPPASGKTWKAYFCPAPKGAPDQCNPEFVR